MALNGIEKLLPWRATLPMPEIHVLRTPDNTQALRERVVTEILRKGYAPSHAISEARRVVDFVLGKDA